MVGDTDVEGMDYNSYCTISISIFNLQYGGRYLTHPIQWGPPGARSGWVAASGDVCGNRYFVWFCLVRINGMGRPSILLAGSHSLLVLEQSENNA